MTEIQINSFIEQYSKYFSEESLNSMLPRLQEYPEEMYPRLMNIDGLKSPTTALILAFFVLDRLYLKDYVMGILKLLLSSFFIWTIVDLFSVRKRTYALNEKLFFDSIGDVGYLDNFSNDGSYGGTGNVAQEKSAFSTEDMKNIAGQVGKILNDPKVKQSGRELKNAFKGFRDSL